MLPSISSLEKICNAFEITLSEFFALEEDNFTLTDVQKKLLTETNRLTDKQKLALLDFLKTL